MQSKGSRIEDIRRDSKKKLPLSKQQRTQGNINQNLISDTYWNQYFIWYTVYFLKQMNCTESCKDSKFYRDCSTFPLHVITPLRQGFFFPSPFRIFPRRPVAGILGERLFEVRQNRALFWGFKGIKQMINQFNIKCGYGNISPYFQSCLVNNIGIAIRYDRNVTVQQKKKWGLMCIW